MGKRFVRFLSLGLALLLAAALPCPASASGAEDDPSSGSVLSCSLKLDPTMVRPKDEGYIVLQGTAELAAPVDSVTFTVWDEWQRKTDLEAVWTPKAPTASLDAEEWKRVMKTQGLAGGRKTLTVTGYTGGQPEVIASLPFFVAGKVPDPPNLTSLCSFSSERDRLTDAKADTYWSQTEWRRELTVTLPEDGSAVLAQIEWYSLPEKAEITFLGADGETLETQTMETGFLVDTVFLPAGARAMSVLPTGNRVRISSVRVYGEEYPRDLVQEWQPMPEKLDMLLFSAHQDDEVLFFAGLVPWYAHLEKSVGIVYMANCGRARYKEALDAMWFSGMRIHPVFLGYRDKEVSSIKVAENIWPGSQEAIVRQIRRCKPDVVVVQDLNGEYGHTQHRLTSQQVCLGVQYAADPSYDPDSAAEYGAWEVKKLYVHLYEEGRVSMDWKIPMAERGGLTPWDIAVEAFELHQSQYGYFRMERQGIEYDSSCFGLYRTTVGPDTPGANDMFEHID